MKLMPKNDVVFKRLFGTLGSESLLKSLIEAVLDTKIKKVTLDFNQEFLPENLSEGRKNIVDVVAQLVDGTFIDVEMQSQIDSKIGKKMLFYWSRMYANQAKKGDENLETLHKTIAIWIIDQGNMNSEHREYHSVLKIKDDKNNTNKLLDDFEIHIIELSKLRKYGTLSPRKIDFWMWFIDHTNEEMVEMGERTMKEIQEAVDKLRELESDPIVSRLAFRQQVEEMERNQRLKDATEQGLKRGMKKGIKQGIKQGIEKGIKQGIEKGVKQGIEKGVKQGIEEGRKEGKAEGLKEGKLQIAKKMKEKGLCVSDISELTGIPEEKIKEL